MCGLSKSHRAVELRNGDDTSGQNLQWGAKTGLAH